ncbi:MAG: type II toxin-antitoxin system HicA family toxin [Candidatus Portnoybacteria bacterium]|nr:type II toxin-antitoxin system HicA family toxin [Candidatus Portnoybacteria bacterium]
MGVKFPSANYRQTIKVAKKLGFYFYRQAKGSHEIWRRPDGRYTTIPRHGTKSIKRKTLKGILEDLQITPQEFIKLRKGK